MSRIGFVATVAVSAIAFTPAAWAQSPPPPAVFQQPAPAPGGVYAPPPGQQTPAPTPMAQDGYRMGPQGFSVVLVLGDMQSASPADSVPPAARKALADMKDFLPYKGYRLLDVQWTLCCGRNPVVSRLRGADDQEYELELTPSVMSGTVGRGVSGGGGPVVSVRFLLREPYVTEADMRQATIESELTELRRRQNDLEKKLKADHPDARANAERIRLLAQELNERPSPRRSGPGRAVIDASFRMDVGETVVVGTSRVKGGEKALIALLTAVPQKAAQTAVR